LGARSVPVVSRGDDFTFAQDFSQVAAFVGIDYNDTRLPPDQLVAKLDLALAAGQRLTRQIPDESIGGKLPGRDRSYLQLSYHIFEIASAFLTALRGAKLDYALFAGVVPEDCKTGADIAGFGQVIRDDVADWWSAESDRNLVEERDTYYGLQSTHALLERTTWHIAQHCRQMVMVLEKLDIEPDGPLSADDLAGLPLPDKVWDDDIS
jgi:hypothetical protein